jgi:hypothetical protein
MAMVWTGVLRCYRCTTGTMRLVGTLVYKKGENLWACKPGVGQKIAKILGNNRINRQYTYIKRRVSIGPGVPTDALGC